MERINQANESRSKTVTSWKIVDFVHFATISFKNNYSSFKSPYIRYLHSFKLAGVLNNDKLVCMPIFFTTNIKGVHISL